MAKVKTKPTNADVKEFINSFANTEQKRKDSFELVELMQDVTGYEPKMWGPSIIGFGMYHYRSDKSRQEGYWPLVGFSPRKTCITLYAHTGKPEQDPLLRNLGDCKVSRACIYFKKLSDINTDVLRSLIKDTIAFLELKYAEKKTSHQ